MKAKKNTNINYKEIILTGKTFIKYLDDIIKSSKGDILFYLNDDSTAKIVGDYDNLNISGYFKAKIYDGREWQLINLEEFFENKEYKFSKKERSIDVARYCQEIINKFKGELVFRTYRSHFSRFNYEQSNVDNKISIKKRKL